MPYSDSAATKNKIINVIVLVVFSIGAAQAYRYQLGEMKKLRSQQEEERKKNNLLDNIGVMEKKLAAYKSILRERDTSTVMNTFSSLAQDAGLKIDSVRPGTQQKYQQYRKILFLLKVTSADYHAIARFISMVESHQEVYIVESLVVNKVELRKEIVADITLSTVSLMD